MVEILVAIIGGLALILVAQLERVRQHAKAARDQVQNSHPTNLRDELDKRFQAIERRFDDVDARIERVARVRRRLRRHWWHQH